MVLSMRQNLCLIGSACLDPAHITLDIYSRPTLSSPGRSKLSLYGTAVSLRTLYPSAQTQSCVPGEQNLAMSTSKPRLAGRENTFKEDSVARKLERMSTNEAYVRSDESQNNSKVILAR